MSIKEAVIISAARTPTGKFLGALKGFSAPELGAIAIKEAVKRAGVDPAKVDEVIMGCVVSAGIGQAPARQAALKAGLPVEVSALTVNMVCGSGLRAVALASQSVQLGDSEFVVAGGMESMSNIPRTYKEPQVSPVVLDDGRAIGVPVLSMIRWKRHPHHTKWLG